MRVVVDIDPLTKRRAEARARTLGYHSLATMLRVVASGLARDYNGSDNELLQPAAGAAVKSVLPENTAIPDPSQFSVWPKHIPTSISKNDPQFYLFCIEQGIIR